MLAASVAALTLSAPAVASAGEAPEGARPIPNDDRFQVYASGEYTLDVLANDETSLLSNGELTLCGVGVGEAAERVLFAEIDRLDPSRVYVELNRNAEGMASFTYDACQGDQRATSTVTLDISLLLSPKVVKAKRPGRIKATNRNEEALQILWGSNQSNVNDGRRSIAPGRTIVIKVRRTRIYWVSYLIDQGALIVAGDGTVRRIKKARGARPAGGRR